MQPSECFPPLLPVLVPPPTGQTSLPFADHGPLGTTCPPPLRRELLLFVDAAPQQTCPTLSCRRRVGILRIEDSYRPSRSLSRAAGSQPGSAPDSPPSGRSDRVTVLAVRSPAPRDGGRAGRIGAGVIGAPSGRIIGPHGHARVAGPTAPGEATKHDRSLLGRRGRGAGGRPPRSDPVMTMANQLDGAVVFWGDTRDGAGHD